MREEHTPARLLLGQRIIDRLFPTSTKYESLTGDCTAITRQFAQSSPSMEGSIWLRRGNRPSRAISFQSRSTRSTNRRSLCIAISALAFCSTQCPKWTEYPFESGLGS